MRARWQCTAREGERLASLIQMGKPVGARRRGVNSAGPEVPPVLCSVVWLFVTPWAVARQAPLSMEFSRQECWSVLPFPSPGNLPDPGIEPTSPALAGGFHLGSPFRKGS